MNYRCPHCRRTLDVRKLFLHDISACAQCGQKVVLGDFLAFFMAALAMSVSALSALYLLSQEFAEYYVAAGYAVAIGMAAGVLVLLALGRAVPFKRAARRRVAPLEAPEAAPKA
jgi:DNA-directed RNA polymerase subunit RPC12/RpoP